MIFLLDNLGAKIPRNQTHSKEKPQVTPHWRMTYAPQLDGKL